MKEFFSSIRFKILIGLAIMMGAFMLRAAWTGGFGTLTSSVIGAVSTPVQRFSAKVSDTVNEFFSTFVNASAIKAENEKLQQELRDLNQKIVDYDRIIHENQVYKDFLKLKEHSKDLELEPAAVMGRDASERCYSFTIDKGSLNGIDVRDTVIAKDGMIGFVSEVGLTYSKVTTILDPASNVGVIDSRTRDTALITGTIELAEQGLCRMYLLPRESGAAVGDVVVTSGISGLYPRDQLIGKIVKVMPEEHGSSLYALVQPFADIKNVTDVMVIKSFVGQGSSLRGVSSEADLLWSPEEGSKSDETSSGASSEESASESASSSASSEAGSSASGVSSRGASEALSLGGAAVASSSREGSVP